MKITLLAENIQKKLSFVGHAVSNKAQLPILSNVLLDAKGDTLTISSTDLEIGIEVTIHANIEEEGATTVPAKLFTELINALPAEKITLSTKDNSLIVESKKSKSTLQTISREEFPVLFEEKGDEVFAMKATELKKQMSMIVFTASAETTRPALSGILMKQTPEGFLFVATDGYRLSLKVNKGQTVATTEKPIIVPVRVLRELSSFSDEGTISLYISGKNNQVIFSQEDMVLIGRLIDAEFPNYQKIIPTDVATTVTFDRQEMHKAVKTCAIFARETANIITFTLQKEKIIVSAKTPSLGENTVEVEAHLTGEENQIAFNAKYLLDVLTNIVGEQIVFEMTGPLNPGVFKIAQDASYLHLIMPIRV